MPLDILTDALTIQYEFIEFESMSCRASYLMSVLPILVGGCSIHPLPQDATHVNSYQIVAQVRCEVRSALDHFVKEALRARMNDAHLADDLENGKIRYDQLLGRISDPSLKNLFLRYASATVGYNFSLDMTESNNFAGSATLTRPITRGTDTVGFAVGSDHKRENTRTFTIEDTFIGLLTIDTKEYCSGFNQDRNFDYPITGSTRLAETVGTFLDLNQSGHLGIKLGGPKTPTLTDDLQFTTSYTGSVSPGFAALPLAPVLAWSAATGKIDTSRSDLHRVTVAFAMPEKSRAPTALTLAQSRDAVRQALATANGNRLSVNL